ncbi:btb-domain-containing protein [Anaeramoeba ignava]|uniref:Btb-domain-containing protein n=1 Tax=Anaeramoeba ignava TaxID=1746090 RepID=A0A9Q0LBZ0_ANAIG|nr:btb-domain-containing protein [Anaeramoeba ignava]
MTTYLNLEKLSNDLKNLFQNQNQNQNQNEKKEESYFDFEIICEQNKNSFKTHKSILSSRSDYFKSLFKSKMKEYQENKLILKDVSSLILSSILNYFYSGKIEINSENSIQILIFSSKYLIDELINVSSKFIKNNLEIETIVDILKLSDSMNLTKLLDYSYRFIFDNFNEFIKTPFFLELEENHLNSILLNGKIFFNEFEIFQSIIKWGKHKSNINQEKENQKLEKKEKEKIQDQISNIIDKIRFVTFSNKELANILKEELIPNEISQQLIKLLIMKNQENKEELKQFIENQNSLIFKTRIGLNSSTIIQEKEHFDKLKEWINDDEFFSNMKLGYSSKRDGFDCKKWHDKVDNKGKTLIIIKTKDNYIFGGFTSIGFTNDNSKWREKDIRKEQKAIFYDYSDFGPSFGRNGDFSLNFNLQNGRSNFGDTYNLPKGIEYKTNESQSYLAGSFDKWEIDELEKDQQKVINNLIQNYSNLFKESPFNDFSIFVRKNKSFEFKVHKSILFSRSPFFQKFFKDNKESKKIEFPNFKKSSMESILKYIYFGEISFENEKNLFQIDEISKKTNENEYLKNELLNQEKQITKLKNHISKLNQNLEDWKNKKLEPPQVIEYWQQNLKEKVQILYKHEKKIQDNWNIEIQKLQNKAQQIKREHWMQHIEELKKTISKLRPNQDFHQFFEIFINSEISESNILQNFQHVIKLHKWINDNDFFSNMKKGYSTKKDGFNCKKWHDICDNKGKTLDFDYIKDKNAFIFSLRNDKNDRKPNKFSIQKGKEQYALYYFYSDRGPIFGASFWLNSNLQPGNSNFGYIYNLPKGIKYGTNESKSYLAGSCDEWEVDELETFFI